MQFLSLIILIYPEIQLPLKLWPEAQYTDTDHVHEYRKISNTIRPIFTKNRGPAAGVRIIHLN